VEDRDIVVADYDASWPQRAARLIDLVLASAPGVVHRVDHIGSTAIPAMPAKPVIDLQAQVDDLDRAVEVLVAPLAELGFALTPYNHDHVPAGSNDAPERWVKRLFARNDHPDGPVNLHVRLLGSRNARLALLFRDWFRAHPAAVPAYAAFKRSLASEVGDIGAYSDVKDPVVDLIVTIADTWADEVGWTPEPRSRDE
jgi:GrpB-like predicted nucleotidyltransferase (UPF0157 family)